MVGHHLKSYNGYLWITLGDFVPAVFNPLAQLAKHDTRLVGVSNNSTFISANSCSIATTNDLAKEGTATFDDHCDKVHLAVGIVVVDASAEHGGFLFSCKGLLLFVGFAFHVRKNNIKTFPPQIIPPEVLPFGNFSSPSNKKPSFVEGFLVLLFN